MTVESSLITKDRMIMDDLNNGAVSLLDDFDELPDSAGDTKKSKKKSEKEPRAACNTPEPEGFVGNAQDIISLIASRAQNGTLGSKTQYDNNGAPIPNSGAGLDTPMYLILAPLPATSDEVFFSTHKEVSTTGVNAGKLIATTTKIIGSLPNEFGKNPTPVTMQKVTSDSVFPAMRATEAGKVPGLVLNGGLRVSYTLKTQTISDVPTANAPVVAPVNDAETATA